MPGEQTFAAMLRARVAEEEVTLEVIAKRVRAHHTVLASWLHGRTLPSRKMRVRISHFLRVTPEKLDEIVTREKNLDK